MRIWGVARTPCEIFTGMNAEVTSGTGLLGRWGLGEGAGSVANNSAGFPNGILMNGPTWVPGSPFNIPPPTLNQPTNLTANPPDGVQIQLAWTDNSTGETSYEVERSTTGTGGPFSLIASLPANSESYVDAPLSPSTDYCYRVRASANCPGSNYSDVVQITTMVACNAFAVRHRRRGDHACHLRNPASLQRPRSRRCGCGGTTASAPARAAEIRPHPAGGERSRPIRSLTQDINYI